MAVKGRLRKMEKQKWVQFEDEVMFPKYEEIFVALGERNNAKVNEKVYVYSDAELVGLIVCLLNKMGTDEDRARLLKKVITYYRARALKNEREKNSQIK